MNVFASFNFDIQGKEMYFVGASEQASKGTSLSELAKYFNI